MTRAEKWLIATAWTASVLFYGSLGYTAHKIDAENKAHSAPNGEKNAKH